MRKITRETAIKLTRKQWRWLAMTGGMKEDYFNVADHRQSRPILECFLCEYSDQQNSLDSCSACPYYQTFGRCVVGLFDSDPEKPFSMWEAAKTDSERKMWAEKVVEQLDTLV